MPLVVEAAAGLGSRTGTMGFTVSDAMAGTEAGGGAVETEAGSWAGFSSAGLVPESCSGAVAGCDTSGNEDAGAVVGSSCWITGSHPRRFDVSGES